MKDPHLENADILKVSKTNLIRRIFWAAFIAIFALAFFLALDAEAPTAPEPPTAQIGATNPAPDPCGLADVECRQEAASEATAAQGPRQTLRGVAITTYQAVAAQTDATPCVGAMAGVDFCNPPFPIVANNCLPLGTEVTFDFTFTMFTVADRMASRFGCEVFDILTDGTNYRYANETAYIQ